MNSHLLNTGAVRFVAGFFPAHAELFELLKNSVAWDTRLKARKSASFGRPYNYSGIEWPARPFPPEIAALLAPVAAQVGFEPNNCLANFYPGGHSSMGFHSDSTAELEAGTGIAVLSLGAERTITFRRIGDETASESYPLVPGSLLWMCPEMQTEWRHAVLADKSAAGGRVSLTFRRMET
ncbi:MAG TPA: alpha-ketoglutarate-dependent dioxygenase AlkB [Gemmata sp.]